jgi:enediyne biosynthesis protein E4
VHFSLSKAQRLDSLVVQWQDGKKTILHNIAADQTLKIQATKSIAGTIFKPKAPTLFNELTPTISLDSLQKENLFIDFKYQTLLPHRFSQSGPPMAVGDLNGDGFKDVFIGRASGEKSCIFIQNTEVLIFGGAQPRYIEDFRENSFCYIFKIILYLRLYSYPQKYGY